MSRLLPMAPEMARFLEPHKKKNGYVFCPSRVLNGRKSKHRRNAQWISLVGSRIGKRAEVSVSLNGTKEKCASFHDLRRSFGER